MNAESERVNLKDTGGNSSFPPINKRQPGPVTRKQPRVMCEPGTVQVQAAWSQQDFDITGGRF